MLTLVHDPLPPVSRSIESGGAETTGTNRTQSINTPTNPNTNNADPMRIKKLPDVCNPSAHRPLNTTDPSSAKSPKNGSTNADANARIVCRSTCPVRINIDRAANARPFGRNATKITPNNPAATILPTIRGTLTTSAPP